MADVSHSIIFKKGDFYSSRQELLALALFLPLACLADPTTWPPATDWIEIRRNGNRRFRGNNGMWTDSAQARRT